MARRGRAPHRRRRQVWALIVVLALVAAVSRQMEVALLAGGGAALLLLGLTLDRLARGRPVRRVARASRRGGVDAALMRLDGSDFEALCAELLRAQGARVVEQGGGGDQGADLLVSWRGRRLVVQCKRLARNVGNAAVQQAHAAAAYYKADGAIVMTNREFTRGARELAQRCSVELVGRARMESLLRSHG